MAAPFPNFSTTSNVLSSSAASAIATNADSDSPSEDANSGRDNCLHDDDDENDDDDDDEGDMAVLAVDEGTKARQPVVTLIEVATASASVQADIFIMAVVFLYHVW